MEAKQLFQLAKKDGGFSYNPASKVLNPTTGFMVSLVGHETTFKLTQTEAITEEIQSLLEVASNGFFVGAWFDDETGLLYLDLSERFECPTMARKVGKERKQKAIWDCCAFKEIRL